MLDVKLNCDSNQIAHKTPQIKSESQQSVYIYNKQMFILSVQKCIYILTTLSSNV